VLGVHHDTPSRSSVLESGVDEFDRNLMRDNAFVETLVE
jgi:hypothetical protein